MNDDLLKKELIRDEGIRKMPYRDTTGHLTVGIGFNLSANPLPNSFTFPLDDDEVEILYERSVKEVIGALNLYLPWWTKMDEVRQRVLVNMCFNLGIYKLLNFVTTLKYMRLAQYDKAAQAMENSVWYTQVKGRAVRLCEAMRTGAME
jgi:lysozyme